MISASLMIASLVGGVTMDSTIEHTDPQDDVESDGVENYAVLDDMDIISLSVDHSSDPLVIELEVVGAIYMSGSTYVYSYYIYLDHDGDDTADSTVSIENENRYITGTALATSPTQLTGVSGDETPTLRIEVPHSVFDGSPSVDDVWAMTDCESGGDSATDKVNEYFQGEEEQPQEMTPPSDDVDPGSETPTNPSLGFTIDTFTMDISFTETTYDYTIQATGSGSDDVVKAYYCMWAYAQGHGGPEQSWEESPIDEEHSYGDHEYKEEFFGTGPGGSWSTWKWTFHSAGPLTESNKERYENPENYWAGLDSIILYVRGYDSEGDWDQDSEDITEEYTGMESSGSPGDDDTGDDDTGDDDGNETGEESDDSPGFGITMAAAVLIVSALILIKRRKK